MSTNWPKHDMSFLGGRRQRRLRRTGWMRNMVRETVLTPHDLIWPLFVIDGHNERTAIRTLPGVERLSVDLVVEAAKAAAAEGIPALALFPNTQDDRRNADGSEAWNPDNLTGQAVRAIRDAGIDIGLITDVALDEYSSDGQDGLVRDGEILNDETVEAMVKAALMQARAGADIIAPSDMMDGRVAAIRRALDGEGFDHVAIMAYSAKFASVYYGPFREAVGSGSRLVGDKRTYQLDYANSDEAMREVAQDIAEGARHALPRYHPALQRRLRRAAVRLPGVGRVRDDPVRRGGGGDQRRGVDDGKPHGVQAGRVRRRTDLLCA